MNESIIQKYQEWKSIKHERSSVSYPWMIKRFFKFTNKDFQSVTLDDIIGYQSYLKKNYADATQAIEANVLRSFFQFTNKRGLTTIDTTDITIPRICEKVPIYVVQDEFIKLCDTARYIDPQIHLAIRVLWFTGVRVSELCNIEIADIDMDGKFALVQTKKAFRPKQIFWDDETHELIKGLLRVNPLRQYLFEPRGGGKISTRQVERWVRMAVEKSGICKHITPHAFRHGATKEWLNNGVDLPAIKDLLGHRSLLSIEKYTKRLDDDIKEKGREAVRQRVRAIRYDLKNL